MEQGLVTMAMLQPSQQSLTLAMLQLQQSLILAMLQLLQSLTLTMLQLLQSLTLAMPQLLQYMVKDTGSGRGRLTLTGAMGATVVATVGVMEATEEDMGAIVVAMVVAMVVTGAMVDIEGKGRQRHTEDTAVATEDMGVMVDMEGTEDMEGIMVDMEGVMEDMGEDMDMDVN